MLLHNLRSCLKLYFDSTQINNYHVDHAPPFDDVQNDQGFFVWDTEDHKFNKCSEDIGYNKKSSQTYTDNYITCDFTLEVTCYSNLFLDRANISKKIMDLFYPITNGIRVPLRGLQITNGYIHYMEHINTTEYPIQKRGQSIPELSASILLFESSISVKEI